MGGRQSSFSFSSIDRAGSDDEDSPREESPSRKRKRDQKQEETQSNTGANTHTEPDETIIDSSKDKTENSPEINNNENNSNNFNNNNNENNNDNNTNISDINNSNSISYDHNKNITKNNDNNDNKNNNSSNINSSPNENVISNSETTHPLPINDIESVEALASSPLSPSKRTSSGRHLKAELDEQTLSWIRASKEAEDIEIAAMSHNPSSSSSKRRSRSNTAPPSTTPRPSVPIDAPSDSLPSLYSLSSSSNSNQPKENSVNRTTEQENRDITLPDLSSLSIHESSDISISSSSSSLSSSSSSTSSFPNSSSLSDRTGHTPTPRPFNSSEDASLPNSNEPSAFSSTYSNSSSESSFEKVASPPDEEHMKLGPVERWNQIEKPDRLGFESLLDYLDKGLEAERLAESDGDSSRKNKASEMVSSVMDYITAVTSQEARGGRKRHRTLTIVRPLISVRQDDMASIKRSYRATELIVEPPNNDIYSFVRKNIERITMQILYPLQKKEINRACIFHIGAVLQMATAVFPKHLTQMCIEGNLIMDLFLPHLHRSPMIDVVTAILFQGGMEEDSDDEDDDDEVNEGVSSQLESKTKDKSLGAILTSLHGHLAEKRFFAKIMQMVSHAALNTVPMNSEEHEVSSAATELFAEVVRTLGPSYPVRIVINRWEMESLRNTLGTLVRGASLEEATLASRTFCAETLFNLTVCVERLSMKITDARLRSQVQTFTGSLFITLQMLFPQLSQSLTIDSEPGVSTLQLHCISIVENTLKYFGQYHGAEHLESAADRITPEAWGFVIDRFLHHDNCSLLHCAFTRIVCRLIVHRASMTIDHLLQKHNLLERLVEWHEHHPRSPVRLHILTVLSVLAKKQGYLLHETRERMEACDVWQEFLTVHQHDIEALDVPFEDTAAAEDSGTVFSDSSSDSAEIFSDEDEEL